MPQPPTDLLQAMDLNHASQQQFHQSGGGGGGVTLGGVMDDYSRLHHTGTNIHLSDQRKQLYGVVI